MFLQSIFSSLSQLAIPIHCVRCSVEGEIICARCSHSLFSAAGLKDARLRTPHGVMRLSAHLAFNEEVSRVVLGAKDDGNSTLENIVIDALIRARSQFSDALVLVPIPSTARARRKRGRDFVVDVTKKVAQACGDQMLPLLEYARKVEPQKSLNASERTINMRAALRVRRDIFAQNQNAIVKSQVLLVDDVLTTGATMREGFRALQVGGACCIGGISAAYSLNWSASH